MNVPWGASLLAASLLVAALGLTGCVTTASYEAASEPYSKGDYKEAYEPMLQVAQAGDARAQFIIGVMYDAGQSVAADRKAAVQWYARAAEQGEPNAQFRLAGLYFFDPDVPRDPEQAYRWALLSADGKSGTAREQAIVLSGVIAQSLSEDARRSVQAVVAAWRPRYEQPQSPASRVALAKQGSGFVVNAAGMIVTNYHVIAGCSQLVVRSRDQTGRAHAEAMDFGADLALLRSDLQLDRTAVFGADQRPTQGSPVEALGFAVERAKTTQMIKSLGTVINPLVAMGNGFWFETSAPAYHGESGGPVTNAAGEVVGVIVAVDHSQSTGARQEGYDGATQAIGLERVVRLLKTSNTRFDRMSDVAQDGSQSTAYVVRIECWN
jgi:S1-C subfamily serine protease